MPKLWRNNGNVDRWDCFEAIAGCSLRLETKCHLLCTNNMDFSKLDTLIIRKRPVTIERNLMIKMASPQQPNDVHYTNLPILQKTEVFESALNDTTGRDVAKMLWLRSPSSEVSLCLVFSSIQFCLWSIHR